jgi:hypothetical protein
MITKLWIVRTELARRVMWSSIASFFAEQLMKRCTANKYHSISLAPINLINNSNQVYKAALQGMMKARSQYRYFSKQDLSEMFTLDDTSSSATQRLLTQLHDHNANTYPYLDRHVQFLHESLGIVGVNHHDLLFSESPEDLEPSEEGKAVAARAHSSVSNDTLLQ